MAATGSAELVSPSLDNAGVWCHAQGLIGFPFGWNIEISERIFSVWAVVRLFGELA